MSNDVGASRLIEEQPTRASATVGEYRDAYRKQVRPFLRNMKYFVVVVWLGSTAFFGYMVWSATGFWGAVAMSAAMGMFYGSWWVAARLFVLRDERQVVRLVRDGTAVRARVLSHASTRPTVHRIKLAWDENGHERHGRLQIRDVKLERLSEVTLLAIPKHGYIVASIHDAMYVGFRTWFT